MSLNIAALFFISLQNAMVAFFLMMGLVLSFKFWYVLCQALLHFTNVSFCNESNISLVMGENFAMYFIIPKNYCNFVLVMGWPFPLSHAASVGLVSLLFWISRP